jgi:hypothetical protein
VECRPKEIFSDPSLRSALSPLIPDDRLEAFAVRHGGVDLRRVADLAIAAYPEAMLALARVPVDPGRVETAFHARALTVEGRAESLGITRTWGSLGDQHEQIAVFGHQAVGLERGKFGPLRAATLFAEGRLARARPALEADPLAEAARKLGDAPMRAFAPGPFEGEWAHGLGGLLRATTAVGAAAWTSQPAHAGAAELRASVVVLGAWGDDAPAAGERLVAAFSALAKDPLGRLTGLDHPLSPARLSTEKDALRLDVTLDAAVLARGLYDVTTATAAEVMAY